MAPKKHRPSHHRVPAHPAVLVPLSVPLVLQVIALIYSTRYKLFSIGSCIIRPTRACANGSKCNDILECFRESEHPKSTTRKQAFLHDFAHVPFQNKDLLPEYQCQYHQSYFDPATTAIVQNPVAACFDSSNKKCVKEQLVTADENASTNEQCVPAVLTGDPQALPFDAIPENILEGSWTKLYTSSWDFWPCQTTEFLAPSSPSSSALNWTDPIRSETSTSWRMNSKWAIPCNSERFPECQDGVFHMSREFYPGEKWDFPWDEANGIGSNSRHSIKSRATFHDMKELHENWYVLDFDSDLQTLILAICAYNHTDAPKIPPAVLVVWRKNRTTGVLFSIACRKFSDDSDRRMLYCPLILPGTCYDKQNLVFH